MTSHYFNVNREKHSIHCKLYCEDPKAVHTVVLFGHGFGGHKDNRAAEKFAARVIEKNKGIAVITFNWPCHGDDVKKKLSLVTCDEYLRLVLSEIQSVYEPEHLFAYATSFGGYLFLKYIAEHGSPFEKTALRCPAVPMFDVITKNIMSDDDLSSIARGKSILVGFDRKIAIAQPFLDELQASDIRKFDYMPYADEILILQGQKDEIVPAEEVKAFAEKNLIDYIPYENADHRFQDPQLLHQAHIEMIRYFGLK